MDSILIQVSRKFHVHQRILYNLYLIKHTSSLWWTKVKHNHVPTSAQPPPKISLHGNWNNICPHISNIADQGVILNIVDICIFFQKSLIWYIWVLAKGFRKLGVNLGVVNLYVCWFTPMSLLDLSRLFWRFVSNEDI